MYQMIKINDTRANTEDRNSTSTIILITSSRKQPLMFTICKDGRKMCVDQVVVLSGA